MPDAYLRLLGRLLLAVLSIGRAVGSWVGSLEHPSSSAVAVLLSIGAHYNDLKAGVNPFSKLFSSFFYSSIISMAYGCTFFVLWPVIGLRLHYRHTVCQYYRPH